MTEETKNVWGILRRAGIVVGLFYFSNCFSAYIGHFTINHYYVFQGAVISAGFYIFIELARMYGVKLPSTKKAQFNHLLF